MLEFSLLPAAKKISTIVSDAINDVQKQYAEGMGKIVADTVKSEGES